MSVKERARWTTEARGRSGDRHRRLAVVRRAPPIDEATRALTRLTTRHASAARIDELFAIASADASRACGYARALVLVESDGALRATHTGAIALPGGDALRRAIRADPVPLLPGCAEDAALRRLAPERRRSVLADAHGLDDPGFASFPVEGLPGVRRALLVADRPVATRSDVALAALATYARLLEHSVRCVALRLRLARIATELGGVAASCLVLASEAHAPVDRMGDVAPRAVPDAFAACVADRAPAPSPSEHAATATRLTVRETRVADLLATGCTYGQIAETLHLSRSTVRLETASIIRKLGVRNRVDAVARYRASSATGAPPACWGARPGLPA